MLQSMGVTKSRTWLSDWTELNSTYEFNKQGDSIQHCNSFPFWNQSVVPCPFQTDALCPAYVRVSQETGKMIWCSHLFKNFSEFVVIHKIKAFHIVNEAKVDVFLEFPWFLYVPMNVGNLISGESKVQCCKEQYCIGTWSVRPINQGKLDMVRQEMARVNINILGISELKWTGMGDFNSDDLYIYYCSQESLRRNGVALIVNRKVWNAVLGCNLKNDRMISVHFQGKPFNIAVIQVYAPTTDAKKLKLICSMKTYNSF